LKKRKTYKEHTNYQAIKLGLTRSVLLIVRSLPLFLAVFTDTETNFFESQIINRFANQIFHLIYFFGF
tara:strand:- start:524 stop:727 length:204 start_codon:yes stop_codon:yes gene_type:complete